MLTVITMVALGGAANAGIHAQDGGALSLAGPPVLGVCLVSREAIFVNAKVGKAASARLKQLADQVQVQLDSERKPIDSDVQAFRAQAATLPADQRQSREQALTQRVQIMQSHQALRSKEIEATRAKALARIAQEAQPIIVGAYRSKNCGLLLDRNAVIGGNMSNDLTASVVQGLDAKISTLSFDLETLPSDDSAGKAR
jgi:Skp family chaperone for outer membrane proteins